MIFIKLTTIYFVFNKVFLGCPTSVLAALHPTRCEETGCPDFLIALQQRNLVPQLPCSICLFTFYGPTCFQQHTIKNLRGQLATPNQSVCATLRRCSDCFKTIVTNNPRDHQPLVCGHAECPSCKDYYDLNHQQCYVQTYDQIKAQKARARQKRRNRTQQQQKKQQQEQKKQQNRFLDQEGSYPIMNCYLGQKRQIEQIRNGGKVLQFQVGRIWFIDSLSFFNMPLSAFASTFGLTELRKGFFPHFFNTPEHQTYVEPLADLQMYNPDGLSTKMRTEFDRWYEQQLERQRTTDYQFNLQEELVAYCCSDGRLLKEGCLCFMFDFQDLAHFNPFSKITIAAACSWDLRRNRLEPNTITSEPLTVWRRSSIIPKLPLEGFSGNSTSKAFKSNMLARKMNTLFLAPAIL